MGSDLPVQWGKGIGMLILMMGDNLKSAEDDEIPFIIDLLPVYGYGRDLMIIGIGSIFQEFRQREQTARLPGYFLPIDLLEAEDIRASSGTANEDIHAGKSPTRSSTP